MLELIKGVGRGAAATAVLAGAYVLFVALVGTYRPAPAETALVLGLCAIGGAIWAGRGVQ